MKPKVFFIVAWSTELNIGAYYNSVMERLKSDEYACFLDADAMFLSNDCGALIEHYVGKYPECGLFTCRTNRVNANYQVYGYWDIEDIRYHRHIAKELSRDDSIRDITNEAMLLSGVLILIRKSLWEEIGKFKPIGLKTVDNDIHLKARNCSKRVYMMNGIYVYHWYRGGVRNDEMHLFKNRLI